MNIAEVYPHANIPVPNVRLCDALAIVNYEIARRLAKDHSVIVYPRRAARQRSIEMHEGVTWHRIPVQLDLAMNRLKLLDKLGVFPPAASALLPARVGASRASRAIITGAPMGTSEWKQAGLIAVSAPSDRLHDEVNRWFDVNLRRKSAAALRHAAAAARAGLVAHVRSVLPELERLYLQDLMRTADAAEGIAAFLERRTPEWKDQ